MTRPKINPICFAISILLLLTQFSCSEMIPGVKEVEGLDPVEVSCGSNPGLSAEDIAPSNANYIGCTNVPQRTFVLISPEGDDSCLSSQATLDNCDIYDSEQWYFLARGQSMVHFNSENCLSSNLGLSACPNRLNIKEDICQGASEGKFLRTLDLPKFSGATYSCDGKNIILKFDRISGNGSSNSLEANLTSSHSSHSLVVGVSPSGNRRVVVSWSLRENGEVLCSANSRSIPLSLVNMIPRNMSRTSLTLGCGNSSIKLSLDMRQVSDVLALFGSDSLAGAAVFAPSNIFVMANTATLNGAFNVASGTYLLDFILNNPAVENLEFSQVRGLIDEAGLFHYAPFVEEVGLSTYVLDQRNGNKVSCSMIPGESTPFCLEQYSSTCTPVWTPEPATVCSGESFTQSNQCNSDTRNGIGTMEGTTWEPTPSTVCDGESFTQTNECGVTRNATGTKDCTPACIPVWTPEPSTVCSGEGFTQSNQCNSDTRNGIGTMEGTTWEPEPSTVCEGETFTQTNECGVTRDATGIKDCTPACTPVWTPEPATVCSEESFTQSNQCNSDTQEAIGTKIGTIWEPDPSTVCEGDTFTQTNECDATREATGSKVGTIWEPESSTVCEGATFTQTNECDATRDSIGTKEGTTWTPEPSTVCEGDTFTQTNECGASRDVTGTQEGITWTPDPSTVCEGDTFTQTNECGTSRDATGTKYCPPPPPGCTPNWRPSPSTVCSGQSFTQRNQCNSNTRQRTGTKVGTTWTPDPSTVCNTKTFTQTNECGATREETGTKECICTLNKPASRICLGNTPRIQDTCGNWVRVPGTSCNASWCAEYYSWSPDPSTVCAGRQFIQTGVYTLVPGGCSNAARSARGTKTCSITNTR